MSSNLFISVLLGCLSLSSWDFANCLFWSKLDIFRAGAHFQFPGQTLEVRQDLTGKFKQSQTLKKRLKNSLFWPVHQYTPMGGYGEVPRLWWGCIQLQHILFSGIPHKGGTLYFFKTLLLLPHIAGWRSSPYYWKKSLFKKFPLSGDLNLF